jgi:hypothetical protein
MKTRVALLLLAATAVAAAASAESFEKTVPVPRTGVARLNWKSGQCSVVLVELRNYPESEDIEKARKSDPNDHSWVWWDFNVENRGDAKCKIKLWVEVLDKDGKVLKQSDRSDTVDAHKLDDNIKVSTRMKTIDIADAPKAHLKAEITSK